VAAESGRVVLSGRRLGDYGNVVIVKHAGRYATVYAHNRRNLVREGEFVEKGQAIAQVGESGNASGPHLHFEIRRDRRAQDPLLYLP
jgi:murein DD-endopeptidase MepM/ murein hydrolase activator NlpD